MARNYINIALFQQYNTAKKLTRGGYPLLSQQLPFSKLEQSAGRRLQTPKNGWGLILK